VPHSKSAINVSSVADCQYKHQQHFVADCVDHAVITGANAEQTGFAMEFLCAGRPRVLSKLVHYSRDSLATTVVELAKRTGC
jgi:hypothetical protein